MQTISLQLNPSYDHKIRRGLRPRTTYFDRVSDAIAAAQQMTSSPAWTTAIVRVDGERRATFTNGKRD